MDWVDDVRAWDKRGNLEARKRDYVERLIRWSGHPGVHEGTWADFMGE